MSMRTRGLSVVPGDRSAALACQKRAHSGVTTKRSFQLTSPRLRNEWFVRGAMEPYSWSQRYGPDKGFFNRDNVNFNSMVNNPWGFLYPGGRTQSPLWQSDAGIGSNEVAGEANEKDMDTAAYKAKMHHNHPELTWDLKPTPFGQYDFDFSCRGGMMGVKVGKTTQIDDYGNMANVYIIWCPDQHVIGHFTKECDGFSAVTVGCYNAREQEINELNPLTEQCLEAGVPVKRYSVSFKVSEDAFVPIGTKLDVRHFVPGQMLQTMSRTVDRGFQGVTFRWGMKGGPTRYGPKRSKAWHRRGGSLSSGEGWGRVPKGKRMAGHMGGLQRTQSNWVWRVDPKNSLIYLMGALPGPMGQVISLGDSPSRKFDPLFGAPPFPTYAPRDDEDLAKMTWEEAQLIGKSRIGYPAELRGMPSAELLETYNFAKKQKELLATERISQA